MFVVLGATGHTGSAVVETLLNEAVGADYRPFRLTRGWVEGKRRRCCRRVVE